MKLVNKLMLGAKRNSPVILSVLSGLGTLTTAYLASKATYKMAKDPEHDPDASNKETVKKYWKLYIPTAISATSTIICIVGANRVSAKKTIAAQTALALSQQAYSEYRDKVVSEIGERKDKAIRDKVAEDQVKNNPVSKANNAIPLVSGDGKVLCHELYTGRYFISTMETLKSAQNELNSKLLKHDYATLNDFYYMVDLGHTSTSSELGWKTPHLMELDFTTVLSDDGRPCLAFDYNYVSTMD